MNLSATYIFHDCFIVRTPGVAVVFDFWRRPDGWIPESPFVGSSPLTEADHSRKIYVLVSHFHKDHYNKEIFSWAADFKDISFIISRDVRRHARHILTPGSLYSGLRPDPDSVKILAPGETFSDGTISVDAFSSTDIGNSYVVTLDDLHIFHAGDLNAWLWKDESTPMEVESERKAFLSCLKPIEDKYPRLDLALFPVDSRIGTDYQEGARMLLERIHVERFIPMHFCLGENDDQRERLRRDAFAVTTYAPADYSPLFALISAPGDALFF